MLVQQAVIAISNNSVPKLHKKPDFRQAIKYRRCIIPSSGFYEWSLVGEMVVFQRPG